MKRMLADGLDAMAISMSAERQQKLLDYLHLLSKWNRTYNLTAVRELEKMLSYHVLDSMAATPYAVNGRWLDVGTGAGLPGMVMAIANPDSQYVLLDSNSKKTSFVRQAAIDLGMSNVQVMTGRVEQLDPAPLFDGVVSRAFADLVKFVSITRHTLKKTGHWVAMTGQLEKVPNNLQAGVTIDKTVTLSIPGVDGSRSLILLSNS